MGSGTIQGMDIYLKIGIAFSLLGIGVIVGMSVAWGHFQGGGDTPDYWIYHYQTMITGSMALAAAGVTVIFMNKQITETKRLHDTEKQLQASGVALLVEASLTILVVTIGEELVLSDESVYSSSYRPIEIPINIRDRVDQLWLMGLAGGNTLRMISSLEVYAHLVIEDTTYRNGPYPQEDEKSKKRILRQGFLNLARTDAGLALVGIKTILNK